MRDKLPGNGGGCSCCRNLGAFLGFWLFVGIVFWEKNVNENFHHKVAVFRKAVMTVKETLLYRC